MQFLGFVAHVVHSCNDCNYTFTWTSSVLLKSPRTYCINVVAPAAVVLSGNQFAKTERFLKALNVQCMSRQAHHDQLELNAYPAIRHQFYAMQRYIFVSLKERGNKLILKGDAQADTPGKKSILLIYCYLFFSCQ